MTPDAHQESISDEAVPILSKYGLVYFAMEERTRKTLTSILTLEKIPAVKRVLVITTKKALKGWKTTIDAYSPSIEITYTNYHQVSKVVGSFDAAILDESHKYISAFPKRKVMWKEVYKKVYGLPIIFMSATPRAQGTQLLYNQLALSKWSPWKHFKNGYRWFDEYGVSDKIHTPYGLKETYKKCDNERAWSNIRHLFITYTRKELGFPYEPDDVLHYVELSEETKLLYNNAVSNGILEVKGHVIPLDSPMKERTALHMLEGGVAKDGDDYIVLDNREKIDAILDTYGDNENVVIMYLFKAEYTKLSAVFKKATLLQIISNAEGVDLSKFTWMVVYSQNYSTATFSQFRARQADKERKIPIKVPFMTVKNAISEQVYGTVSINKTNFVDSTYEKKEL
jgi:hypothetical protein